MRSEKASCQHRTRIARRQQRNNTEIVSHNVILCETNSRNGRHHTPMFSVDSGFLSGSRALAHPAIYYPPQPPSAHVANKHMPCHAPSIPAQLPSGQSSLFPIHPHVFSSSASLFILCILLTHQLSRFLNLYFTLASLASTYSPPAPTPFLTRTSPAPHLPAT